MRSADVNQFRETFLRESAFFSIVCDIKTQVFVFVALKIIHQPHPISSIPVEKAKYDNTYSYKCNLTSYKSCGTIHLHDIVSIGGVKVLCMRCLLLP